MAISTSSPSAASGAESVAPSLSPEAATVDPPISETQLRFVLDLLAAQHDQRTAMLALFPKVFRAETEDFEVTMPTWRNEDAERVLRAWAADRDRKIEERIDSAGARHVRVHGIADAYDAFFSTRRGL